MQSGNKRKILSVVFWSCPEQFCWHSGCIHSFKDMGYLPSTFWMHFSLDCSSKVKRSLEFITQKRLLLWDFSGLKPRRVESSPPLTAGRHNLHCSLRFHSCKGCFLFQKARALLSAKLHSSSMTGRIFVFVSHLWGERVLTLYALYSLFHPAPEPINLALIAQWASGGWGLIRHFLSVW